MTHRQLDLMGTPDQYLHMFGAAGVVKRPAAEKAAEKAPVCARRERADQFEYHTVWPWTVAQLAEFWKVAQTYWTKSPRDAFGSMTDARSYQLFTHFGYKELQIHGPVEIGRDVQAVVLHPQHKKGSYFNLHTKLDDFGNGKGLLVMLYEEEVVGVEAGAPLGYHKRHLYSRQEVEHLLGGAYPNMALARLKKASRKLGLAVAKTKTGPVVSPADGCTENAPPFTEVMAKIIKNLQRIIQTQKTKGAGKGKELEAAEEELQAAVDEYWTDYMRPAVTIDAAEYNKNHPENPPIIWMDDDEEVHKAFEAAAIPDSKETSALRGGVTAE